MLLPESKGPERESGANGAFMAAALDALPACIALLDAQGGIQATNARWARWDLPANPLLWGCTPGTNYLDACDLPPGSEGTLAAVAQGIRRTMAEGISEFRQDYGFETERETRWLHLALTQYSGFEGQTAWVVAQADVTERKELEYRLRSSEALFRAISDNAQDLIALLEPQGARVYSSPSYSSALGYSPEELEGLSRTDLLHPEDRKMVQEALQDLLAHAGTNLIEYRLRHRDGTYRWFESKGTLIEDGRPEDARVLFVARDITTRKAAEREKDLMESRLRQAQKMEAIGQLSAGIAHEINTPTQYIGDNTVFLRDAMTDLCGFLSEVSEALQEPDAHALGRIRHRFEALDVDFLRVEVPKAIEQTLEGVERVSRIVSAMKDFSHPSMTQRESIDLNRAISSTVLVSRNEWKYVADLELDLAPDLPLVSCWPGELNQVLLNLIVNAAHAIGEARFENPAQRQDRISIRTRRSDQGTRIEVQDTGTGIPASALERIFEPFFTTKPVGKGIGQGLSLAHAVIVEKHGGTITVDTRVGSGTTFIIELPDLTERNP